MLVQVISDLHREHYRSRRFDMLPWQPSEQADLFIMAGDIDQSLFVDSWLLNQADQLQKPIIFVPGNHEYYRGVIEDELAELRESLAGTDVHLLDNDEVVLDGVRFLGATLWTDYRAGIGPRTPRIRDVMNICGPTMNDHQLIRRRSKTEPGGTRPFTPWDALQRHRQSARWLENRLQNEPFEGKTVVVTHHGPCSLAQHSHFPREPLSGAFWSNMQPLFAYVDLWVYGHTHECVDTQVGRTRLVSNQAGYPSARCGGFDPVKLVEL